MSNIEITIPNEIAIAGHKYNLFYDNNLKYTEWDATTDHNKQTIDVRPDIPQSRKSVTIIHELLHVVNLVYNSKKCNEEDIWALGEGLWQVVSSIGIEFNFSNIQEKEE